MPAWMSAWGCSWRILLTIGEKAAWENMDGWTDDEVVIPLEWFARKVHCIAQGGLDGLAQIGPCEG